MLDTGALVAIDRGSRAIAALIKRERLEGRVPVTHGGVVGQVGRGGVGRQAHLAQLLPHVDPEDILVSELYRGREQAQRSR